MILKGSRKVEPTEQDQKAKLIESLCQVPMEVICLACIYAKEFVVTGVDITTRWETAEKQSQILQNIYNKAYSKGFIDGIVRGKELEREESKVQNPLPEGEFK